MNKCGCKVVDCKCPCHDSSKCGCPCSKNGHDHMHDGGSGVVYGLGVIGAAIYFIGHATTFWLGVLGFLKAIIWPVFLVFEVLKALIG